MGNIGGISAGFDLGQKIGNAYNDMRDKEKGEGKYAYDMMTGLPKWYNQQLFHTFEDTNWNMTEFVHALRNSQDYLNNDAFNLWLEKNPMYQGVSAEQQAAFRKGKTGVEDQYNVAMEQVLSQMPSGGAKESLIADIAQKRAEGISDVNLQSELMGAQYKKDFINDYWNKAYGATYGAPAAALQSGAAANIGSLQLQQMQNQQAENQAKQSGMGQLAANSSSGKQSNQSPSLVVNNSSGQEWGTGGGTSDWGTSTNAQSW